MTHQDQVFKTKPYAHQLAALVKSRDEPSFALLMEMGTGKTKVVIDTTAWLFSQGRVNGLVVIAPKSICGNWHRKEIPEHLPDHITYRSVLWGPESKAFQEGLKQIFTPSPLSLHVLIMNVEAVGTDRGYDVLEKFLRSHNAMLVIDESTTIKNPKAVRTKVLIKLGRLAKYRRIMTGTPVTQSPMDVFSQFEFLEHGCLGSTTFLGFRNHYAVIRRRYINGRSFDEIVGYQRLAELQESLKPISYRVLKRECLDLPEKIYETRAVELTPAQRRYYEQMRDETLAMLDSGTVVTAPMAITQLLRLRQALCNIAPSPDPDQGTEDIDEKNPRLDALMEVLEEAPDQKVIVWATFVRSIDDIHDAIAKRYGKESVTKFYGKTKGTDRQDIVTAFQDEASPLRFIVMQQRTGGYGITLTAASLMVYYDNDWSLELRQQSEDRAHRIGQKTNVTYVDLVAQGTVDEQVSAALQSKKDLANQVTGDALKTILRKA